LITKKVNEPPRVEVRDVVYVQTINKIPQRLKCVSYEDQGWKPTFENFPSYR